MFTTEVRSYAIDLNRNENQRWDEVIAQDLPAASALVREASSAFELVPSLARWIFGRLYERSGGLYQGEIDAWSKALGVSVGTTTILNCAYELSHLRWPKLFGCTAGIRWIDGLGLVHVRNLDWPLASMGGATRLFRFQRGQREFVSIGVPGHVGILSGMLPGAYSVTINWAPPVAFPSFDFGPAFLLRDTLETCNTFDAAVRTLSETRIASSVFYTVCGVEPHEACVIERTQHQAAIRPLAGKSLVQANHHVAEEFNANNADILVGTSEDDLFSLAGSSQRADTLSRALAEINSPATLESAAAALNTLPVLNTDTCQQMIFCPATGEVRLRRKAAS